MSDKKTPRQDPIKADAADNDVIIDLTDEVSAKTEDDDGIIELKDDLTDDAVDFDDNVNVPEDEVILELDDRFADDENDTVENELIASAITESLGSDEDDVDLRASDDDDIVVMDNEQEVVDEALIDTTDDAPSEAGDEDDDDVMIVNNAPLDEDEDFVVIDDGSAADAQEEEDIFDLEEKIEIEFEKDEDEDELIALDDERSEEHADFVNIVLGETPASGRKDQTEEPTEYLEFNAYQQNDIIDLKEGEKDETHPDAEAADTEAPEIIDVEDLPDLTDVTELDFEDDDEADNAITMIADETDSSDDIIARTVEHSLEFGDKNERLKQIAGTEFESEDDDDHISLDIDRQKEEEMVTLNHDESLDFDENEDLLVDLEDIAELEDDAEIIPLDDSDDFGAEKEDDIVEITEFDQHYPTDSDKMLERAGILDSSGDEEDDFLELIEVDDDRQSEDEEITPVGESDENNEYPELDNFFNDGLEEEGLEPETGGTAFKNFSVDHLLLPEEEAEDAEEASAPESVAETAASDSEDEALDFNFDPGTIAQQVDRLDAFLSDEPEVASLTADDSPGEKHTPSDLPADFTSEELSALAPGQIDSAIERVINEKFSGKIENIIYEVIEKAVAKEIDRLKSALLDGARPDDNY